MYTNVMENVIGRINQHLNEKEAIAEEDENVNFVKKEFEKMHLSKKSFQDKQIMSTVDKMWQE